MHGMFQNHLSDGLLHDIRSAKGEECIPQTWDMYHEKYVSPSQCSPWLISVEVGIHGHFLELCWSSFRTLSRFFS